MGRMLNPKKKKRPSTKQHKALQEQKIDASCGRSNYMTIPIKNPCKESPDIFEIMMTGFQPIVEKIHVFEDPPSEEPKDQHSEGFQRSLEEILQQIKSESFPGRCSDLWKDGEW